MKSIHIKFYRHPANIIYRKGYRHPFHWDKILNIHDISSTLFTNLITIIIQELPLRNTKQRSPGIHVNLFKD